MDQAGYDNEQDADQDDGFRGKTGEVFLLVQDAAQAQDGHRAQKCNLFLKFG